MKPVSEWTETDLLALCERAEPESLTLEFKRLASLGADSDSRRELSKDVSAMANSAGGLIIYGIIERRMGVVPVADRLDDAPDAPSPSPETVENYIHGSIQPRPQDVRVWAIPMKNGNTAYILEVPAATSLGPHQAKNWIYYRRFNFKAEPMHDYEVRDVMRRSTSPHLEFHITFGRPIDPAGDILDVTAIIEVRNLTAAPAQYFASTVFLSPQLVTSGWSRFHPDGNHVVEVIGTQHDLVRFTSLYGPPALPVFQEANFNFERFMIRFPAGNGEYLLGYTIAAPGFVGDRLYAIKRQFNQVSLERIERARP